MAKRITMKFSRDDFSRCGCVEYSYVPEGFRRVIQLSPQQETGTHVDVLPDGINPSHVQVYSLNNNNACGIAGWQFPPGPPYPSELVAASVHVMQGAGYVIGTVHYANGHSISDQQLLGGPVHCPEIPINCND